jgi:hypothetical protein
MQINIKCLIFQKAEFVIVSQELLPKLQGLLRDLPQIKTIIVFEESNRGPISSNLDANSRCKILTFEEVLEYGSASEVITFLKATFLIILTLNYFNAKLIFQVFHFCVLSLIFFNKRFHFHFWTRICFHLMRSTSKKFLIRCCAC